MALRMPLQVPRRKYTMQVKSLVSWWNTCPELGLIKPSTPEPQHRAARVIPYQIFLAGIEASIAREVIVSIGQRRNER